MPYAQRVNTNLEQISDWLTKILVGVGLIQIKEIKNAVSGAAVYIAQGIGEQHRTFAAALVVYFSVIGFLNGYLLTRLWLAGAFSRADRESTRTTREAALHRADQQIPSPSLLPGPDSDSPAPSPPSPSPQASLAAREVVTLRLSQLTTPGEIAVWAKTQVSERNYEEAVNGYSKAVSQAPNDINLRLEYAAALHYAGRPPQKVREQLLEAYARIRNRSDVDENLRMKVYRSLTFQSLFMNAPEGFSDAIKYGEEYIGELGGRSIEGAIAVNLAAAYGQKHKWLQEHSGSAAELKQAHEAALKYAKAAISAGDRWRERLRQLLQKSYPGKDPEDNDLEVFEQDPDFRALLGLS